MLQHHTRKAVVLLRVGRGAGSLSPPLYNSVSISSLGVVDELKSRAIVGVDAFKGIGVEDVLCLPPPEGLLSTLC